MATFISHKRFIEYVSNHACGGVIHSTIDVTFKTIILYGAPPVDDLVNVGCLTRWEDGFAIFAQPDELSAKKKRLALDVVSRFLLENARRRGSCDVVAHGVVSSFYIDDLLILKNLPAGAVA